LKVRMYQCASLIRRHQIRFDLGIEKNVRVVDPERLELPTPAFEAQCSIQLSYGSDLLWDS
jgi:hypothetical protein